MVRRILALLALGALAIHAASAATVTGTLTITVQAPLSISFTPASPTLACAAAPGTVIATATLAGGDGNPASGFTLANVPNNDFAVSGDNVVVGAAGINPADCGKAISIGVTGTQP